jgi:hypothetical protein
MTVSIEFTETYEEKLSAAEVLIGAYDVTSEIFDKGGCN